MVGLQEYIFIEYNLRVNRIESRVYNIRECLTLVRCCINALRKVYSVNYRL